VKTALGTVAYQSISHLTTGLSHSDSWPSEAILDCSNNKQPGEIKKGARVMIDVLTEQSGNPAPLRLVLGQDSSEAIRRTCLETLAILDEWKEASYSTNLDKQ
jgi:hypothetical protein